MINQSNIPLVSVDTMNETHFEEVAIINVLLEQLSSKVDFDTISRSFEKLFEHMQEHFSSEEKLMKEAHYPSLNMHKADHDKVLNEARFAELQWRNKKDVELLREYMEEDVVVWLDQHIKAMDIPMADFISEFN